MRLACVLNFVFLFFFEFISSFGFRVSDLRRSKMRLYGTIALYGYIPFVLLLFALMRNRRHAVIACYVIGVQFLPMDSIKLPILELSKVSACSVGVMLGIFLFDFRRLLTFRPRWYDIPMLAWCICPFVTSMQNDLGAYDGASSMATQTLVWGVPYFVGRIYFTDLPALRELCIGIFIGAFAYIPFCAYEMKMSPQLHRMVYGHFQMDFSMSARLGGWRPMVFMQGGIALGMWMCVASMIGIWLWVTKSVRQLCGIPMGVLVTILFVTAVLCRALSGVLLMMVGLGVLFWVQWLRNALPLYILVFSVPIYMYVRASGVWDGQNLIDAAQHFVGEDRAQSLETRILAENRLTEKAMDPSEHDPWFGFGKWSPYVVYAPWRVGHMVEKHNADTKETFKYFKDECPTDGMWVITLGTFGLLGVISATITIQLPILLARKRLPLAAWTHPLGAPVAVLAVTLALHMLDNLLNAMLNPVFVLAMGGISALGTRGVTRHAAAETQFMPPLAPLGPTGPAGPIGGIEGFPVIPGLQMPPTLGIPNGAGRASQRQASMRASESRPTPVPARKIRNTRSEARN
jgi:hypothetical protein